MKVPIRTLKEGLSSMFALTEYARGWGPVPILQKTLANGVTMEATSV